MRDAEPPSEPRENLEAVKPSEKREETPTVETQEALHDLAEQTNAKIDEDTVSALAATEPFFQALDAVGHGARRQ